MAAVDKIYGTSKQYIEFYDWCTKNNKEALLYFYDKFDKDINPITNFPTSMDRWMLRNCPFDWVANQIFAQYDMDKEENQK